MIKIGFKSFLHAVGKVISISLHQEWENEQEERAAKAEKAAFFASGRTAFGKVQGTISTLGFDPFSTYEEAISRGRGKLFFQAQKAFAPILNEIRWTSNRLNLATGDVFLRNSEGLAIGQIIGTTIQGVATAIFPPLAPVWMVFPWLGGMFGVGIQENGIGLDPAGFQPFSPGGGGYDLGDALQDINKTQPPSDDGGIDIFDTPTPTPRTLLPSGITGPLKKVFKLELADRYHWM